MLKKDYNLITMILMKYVLTACIVSTVVIKFSPQQQQQIRRKSKVSYPHKYLTIYIGYVIFIL